MARLLIIEDERELAGILKKYLVNAGHQVSIVNKGDEGLLAWKSQRPDLVLLDLNLPGLDGIEIAKEIRKLGESPIIMLTARVEEADRLIGLEIGADDYIVKPYSPREVVARVKNVLKRSEIKPIAQQSIQIEDLIIDTLAHKVTKGTKEINLTPTEFDLLSVMANQPGRAYSRLQLLEVVQGIAYEGYERTIDAHIKNLRAKLETNPQKPYYVETVFGIGYRFRARKG
jgi:DNA-binding response OmpR family regulator